MIQAAARECLARLRNRQQPANDFVDSVLTINTPSDIRAELDALGASYEVVNEKAKGNPAWDAHYAEWKQFYADTRPRTLGLSGYLKVSTGTLNNIRSRAQRLEEWKAQLSAKGIAVPEPEKKLPPPDGGIQDAVKLGLLVIGGLGVLSLVRK